MKKISITKNLIVAFALLSLSAMSGAKQTPPVAVHPADKVNVGKASLAMGLRCDHNTECYSSCCSRSMCSYITACKKPKGIFTSLRDVSL